MKKIILYLMLVLIPAGWLNAQEDASNRGMVKNSFFSNPYKLKAGILEDKISADGERYIQGNYRPLKHTSKDRWNIEIGINAYETKNSKIVQLYFTRTYNDVEPRVKGQSPILFKFKDDSIYRGSVVRDATAYHNVLTIGSSVTDRYRLTFYMDIDNNFLEALKKGLTKIRYELNDDIADIVFEEDNLSEFLLEEYQIIMDALNKKRTFEENF